MSHELRLLIGTALAVLIGARIGIVRFDLGTWTVTLLPLVFAFLVGLLCNGNVVPALRRWVPDEVHQRAARRLAAAVMPLIAFVSVFIVPQFSQLAELGPALVLQELGNVGTMLFAMPLAVLGFHMGRESIGATFSIGREGGLAFVFGRYGGGSPEAVGVMGVYVAGTIFGVLFFSVVPSMIATLDILDPRALAMACGTGSASMTGACSASVATLYPEMKAEILALAASSNLMTGLTGLFITLFVTLPVAERYYALLWALRLHRGERP